MIPSSMQKDVLHKLHSAHQGMDRMKRQARQTCYCPQMNTQIENMAEKCSECLKLKPSKPVEELAPRPVPTKPWEKLAVI